MLNRIIGISFALLLLFPAFSSALTTQEIQAQIQLLLRQVRALQQQLLLLQGGGNTTTGGIFCLSLARNLSLGSTGADVSSLQQTLAVNVSIYPEGQVTGYFGRLTQAAVARLQTRYGITGDFSGTVGAVTRAFLQARCATQTDTNTAPTPTSATMPAQTQTTIPLPTQTTAPLSFSATPTSGQAPLFVRFTATESTVVPQEVTRSTSVTARAGKEAAASPQRVFARKGPCISHIPILPRARTPQSCMTAAEDAPRSIAM